MPKIRGANAGFARSVGVLAAGTAGGQAITILASPFVSRLYTPEQFGTFGVYLALVSIAAAVVALRYDAALPLPTTEVEAVDVLALSFLLTMGLSVLAGFALWLAVDYLAVAAVAPATQAFLWLMPIGLFLTGLQQILTMWATRRQAFGASAQSSVLQGATQTASQLVLGLLGAGSVGLTAAYVLARASGVGRLAFTIASVDWRLLRGVSVARLRAAAFRYRRFPLYSLWSSLLNTISVQAPILLLAALFDATVVGWFSITVRVLQLPGTIVGNAVGQVFYARVSRSDLPDVAHTTTTVYRSLVALGTGPMVLLAIGGEEAFALVFGEAWRGAGQYAQWLAPWLLLVFVTAPLSTLVYVRERQRAELAFQIVLLSARVGTLVMGAAIGSATLAIALYGVSSAALWGAYMVWLLRIGGAGTRGPLRWLVRELAVGAALATPLVAATILNAPAFAWAVIAAGCLGMMILRALRVVGHISRDGGALPTSSPNSVPH